MFRRPTPDVPAVTAEEAAGMVKEGALLIDIRELKEWETIRIPGAEFKPLSDIQDWFEQYYSIRFRNYPVADDYVHNVEIIQPNS